MKYLSDFEMALISFDCYLLNQGGALKWLLGCYEVHQSSYNCQGRVELFCSKNLKSFVASMGEKIVANHCNQKLNVFLWKVGSLLRSSFRFLDSRHCCTSNYFWLSVEVLFSQIYFLHFLYPQNISFRLIAQNCSFWLAPTNCIARKMSWILSR